MSDSDLIRRGDAIAALTELPVFSEFMSDALNGNAVLMIHKATTAINTIPAAHPTVKPGEIERAVWGAMGWALRHAKQMPGGIIPAYTDTGNSDAEVECRRSAARILSALDMQPTASPDVAVAAIVVADAIDADMQSFNALVQGFEARPDMPVRHFFSKALRHYSVALARVKGAM